MKNKNSPELDFRCFTSEQLRLLKKLNTPIKVNEYVSKLKYNTGNRLSPAEVLRTNKADCLEAAIFAVAALLHNNFEAFLVDLKAVRDEDHVLCVFKVDNLYGSIAQSKFLGLRYRNPVYKTIRELVMSYFEHYFNFYGELCLRQYSVPYRLEKLGSAWLHERKEILKIEKALNTIRHSRILGNQEQLPRVDKQRFKREILVIPKNTRIGKQYSKTR